MPRGSTRSSEIAAEGEKGNMEGEDSDGPGDQLVRGGPPEPQPIKGGCGCFGYSRRVYHSSSETSDPQEQGRTGSLRAHPTKISRAFGALRGSASSACVANSPA